MSFRLEEIDGTPKAVFEDEDALRRTLLPLFLHPASYFVPDMLYELSLVERNVQESSGFETPYACVEFFRDCVVIEKLMEEHEEGEPQKVTIPLDEAKLLLLEWGVALQRRHI